MGLTVVLTGIPTIALRPTRLRASLSSKPLGVKGIID
jgi:hypothetical protein